MIALTPTAAAAAAGPFYETASNDRDSAVGAAVLCYIALGRRRSRRRRPVNRLPGRRQPAAASGRQPRREDPAVTHVPDAAAPDPEAAADASPQR